MTVKEASDSNYFGQEFMVVYNDLTANGFDKFRRKITEVSIDTKEPTTTDTDATSIDKDVLSSSLL